MSQINILLAEDHRMVREGLRAVLLAEPDFRVVGEADDGLQAMRLTEQLNPDVLVTDLIMPGLNGLEVTRQLQERASKTKVIILSMHNNDTYVLEAIQNGAAGYVLKDASAADLVQAVRLVAAGKKFLSPPLSERALEAYQQRARLGNKMDPYELLSSREREVLQLAAEGYTSSEIASRLFISPRTVETHRANLMHKMNLRTQSELIKYAIRRGIILVEPPVTPSDTPSTPPV